MQKITTPDAILTAACGRCADPANQLDHSTEGKVRGPVCPKHATNKARPLTPATVDTELYYADFTASGIRAALDNEHLVVDHERFAEQLCAQLARMAPLEAIYATHRWQRWYAVQGGHVHTSTACSSCYPTTLWGWHYTLSGADGSTAVAKEGWRICTICVPGAPALPTFNARAAAPRPRPTSRGSASPARPLTFAGSPAPTAAAPTAPQPASRSTAAPVSCVSTPTPRTPPSECESPG
ncbi:hypothetical protein JNW90_00730 [Micromonospora sp. STR1s_5]|nr:hypothetical protein [Micromonospora sp. STR1s_5]